MDSNCVLAQLVIGSDQNQGQTVFETGNTQDSEERVTRKITTHN